MRSIDEKHMCIGASRDKFEGHTCVCICMGHPGNKNYRNHYFRVKRSFSGCPVYIKLIAASQRLVYSAFSLLVSTRKRKDDDFGYICFFNELGSQPHRAYSRLAKMERSTKQSSSARVSTISIRGMFGIFARSCQWVKLTDPVGQNPVVSRTMDIVGPMPRKWTQGRQDLFETDLKDRFSMKIHYLFGYSFFL